MYCDGFSSIVICIMEVTLSEVIWLLLYFEHTVRRLICESYWSRYPFYTF